MRVPSAMPGAMPRAGGEVQRLAVRRAQHERAALRVHVVADEREQSVGELARIVGRRVEREHAIDADRACASSAAATRFAGAARRAPSRAVRRRRPTVRLDRVGAPERAARILVGLRELALERQHARRIAPAASACCASSKRASSAARRRS